MYMDKKKQLKNKQWTDMRIKTNLMRPRPIVYDCSAFLQQTQNLFYTYT